MKYFKFTWFVMNISSNKSLRYTEKVKSLNIGDVSGFAYFFSTPVISSGMLIVLNAL